MIETELAARLAAASGLTALVGARIYPSRAPPNTALPYVVWSRDGTDAGDTMNATISTHDVEFDVECYGADYAASKYVAAQVKDALRGWQGEPPLAVMSVSLSAEFDDYDTEARAHRAALAFTILTRG